MPPATPGHAVHSTPGSTPLVPEAGPGATTTFHLRPAQGWLNDPNGMVRHEGRWHAFFQHNPDAPRHDAIAWGHCSSADLVTWREHPVAFTPTPGGPDGSGCWSGVFVPGLSRPAVVYSGLAGPGLTSTVCLRWGSGADLDEWSAPVVVARQPQADGVAVMRDPFVLTHEGHRFALVGAGLDDGTPAVLLYSCDDIEAWDYLGVWLRGADLPSPGAGPADVWECPQLAVEGERAALLLSLHDDGVLGDVVACAGRLVDDGGRPRLEVEDVGVLDRGDAFYAPQIADDGGEGWWLMGWVREDGQQPGGKDQAGCLTLPRRLTVDPSGVRLELDPAVGETLPLGPARAAEGELPPAAVVEVGPAGAELVHPAIGTRALPEGTRAVVDGDVLEVYPPDAVPATFRHPVAWQVRGDAELRPVLRP